jgi:ketosteroid isomerase-like protein
MPDLTSDTQQIIQVTHQYALGLDRFTPDHATAAFTEDAVWDAAALGMKRVEGRVELLELFKRDAETVAEQYHVTTNHIVEFDDQDNAHGTNYVLAEATTKEGGSIKVAVINQDVYRRTADGWRIASRTILPLTKPHVDRFEL